MRTSHALVLCAAAMAALAFAACKPKPVPTADAVAQLDTADTPWLETSAAVAKDPAKGWQLFVFGYAKGLQASISDFKDAAGGVTPTSSAGLPPAPAADTGHWANDQINVQLANGDLLLLWNGYAQIADAALQAAAPWWNAWPTFDGHTPGAYETNPPTNPARNGLRPAELIWRYGSAAASWTSVGAIDSAYAGGIDVNNVASPDYCAQGVPWVAGYDRPELYADPWGVDKADAKKQRLYASTACTIGILGADGKTALSDWYEQVYVSPDSGASWKASSFRLNMGSTALAATSTGRLFMMQWGAAAGAGAPVVYWSDDFGQTLSAETPYAAPIDATYRLPAKGAAPAQAFPLAALPCSTTGLGPPYVYPPSIATLGPGALLVVYPTTETVASGGAMVTRQLLAVTMVMAPKGGMGPFVVPVALIRPKAQDGSIVMSGLITDHRATANPSSLLYWMETTSQPAAADACKTQVGVIARYAMFAGPSQFPGEIQDLSAAEFQRTPPADIVNDPNWSFGDYMKGTSYVDTASKTLNFVPVWSQEIAGGKIVPFARLVRMSVPVWTAPSANQPLPDGPINIPPGQWGSAPKGSPPPKAPAAVECDQCRHRAPTPIVRGRSTVATRRAPSVLQRVPQVIRPRPAATGKP